MPCENDRLVSSYMFKNKDTVFLLKADADITLNVVSDTCDGSSVNIATVASNVDHLYNRDAIDSCMVMHVNVDVLFFIVRYKTAQPFVCKSNIPKRCVE